MNNFTVSNGQWVDEGTQIGNIGNSAYGKLSKDKMAVHLHYEIKIDGKNINPTEDAETLIDPQQMISNAENMLPEIVITPEKKEMNKLTVFIFATLCVFLMSCGNKKQKEVSSINDKYLVDSLKCRKAGIEAYQKEFKAMHQKIEDSATCYNDTVIMPYRIKYFIVNDDTEEYIHVLKYTEGWKYDEADAVKHKSRKVCLLISDGNRLLKKEIHRRDLAEIIKRNYSFEEEKFMFISQIEVAKKNENALFFKLSLMMEDTMYWFEFNYEFDGKELIFKEYKEFSDFIEDD